MHASEWFCILIIAMDLSAKDMCLLIGLCLAVGGYYGIMKWDYEMETDGSQHFTLLSRKRGAFLEIVISVLLMAALQPVHLDRKSVV